MTEKITEKQYRILNLHAENIKKIKVIDITTDPNSNTVIISGANGNGKSSVLDCIEMACRGGDTLPDVPIRRGEEKGMIELNLGDLKIKRTFTEKGSYLFVETADGARYSKPQEMLDKMLGSISFDPLEFTRLKPKDQYETIKKLVPLKIDIDAAEKAISNDEAERTNVGRTVKELTAQIAGMVIPEGTPEQPVDVSVKAQAIIKARSDRDAFNALLNQVVNHETTIKQHENRVAELKKEIEFMNVKISDELGIAVGKRKEAEESKKKLLKDEDIAVIQTEIDNATAINAAVARRQDKETRQKTLAETQTKLDALDASIKNGRQAKADAIAEAKMPVKGLALDAGMVLYKDIPLSQASTAEQIRVSTAIAMASNPSLRVIRIKDASLLDDDSVEIIKAMAKLHDFQMWLEVVNSDDPMAIVIEDGEVAEPVKKKKAKA